MKTTQIEKAIKDAEHYQKESNDKIREWTIRKDERQRHLDTLRILNI